MNIIDELCQVKANPNVPDIRPGDSIKVGFKVKEANKERLQTFSGLVIKIRRGNGGGNFTIRKVANGIGVEHTFPFASPLLEKVEIVRRGKVRRAKLYYIRRLSTKEARLKERREKALEEAGLSAGTEATPAAEAATPEAK
jgi:large subunit ribosomal protein L19